MLALSEIEAAFPLGTPMRKKSGSNWHGTVVGYYSTELTPQGLVIESAFEGGSVQIYPAKALEVWEESAPPSPVVPDER